MRALVIDGDATPANPITTALEAEGFRIEYTDSGEEGTDLAKLYDFDIITLDLSLPDTTGFEVLRHIRASKITTPVLIVSTMALVTDICKALRTGADDYLTKPFDPAELVARVHALVRRSKGLAQSIVTTRGMALNFNTKSLQIDNKPVPLTGKEYQMLELLTLRKGITLSKDTFLSHLYGGMDEPEVKIIDVYICKLRKKFREATEGREHFIETIWGRGYTIRDNPGEPHVSMTAEVADIMDAPPVYVSKMTFQEWDALPASSKKASKATARA